MKSLVDHLSQYAAYHRDPRNIASHFIGIPLIVVAVAVLLSRPQWVGGWVSPAVLIALASAWFYLRLELRLGVLMTVLLGLCIWAGQVLAQQSTLVWLASGIGMFVVVELAFLLGLRHDLKEQIEARVGGVRLRQKNAAA